MPSTKVYLEWEQTGHPIMWQSNPYTWDDVSIISEIIDAIAGAGAEAAYKKISTEKKKRLIQLVATINGEEYKEDKYSNDNIEVFVKDVKVAANAVLGIEIKIND